MHQQRVKSIGRASKPIAVFLGPSLRKDQACALVDADYYPPARKGDVYRIMTSGVKTIIPHLSVSVAATRAINEAAQSRLTFIHWSREDLEPEAYQSAHHKIYDFFDRIEDQ